MLRSPKGEPGVAQVETQYVYERVYTPWGQPDTKRIYAEGIVSYSTPGHGGFKVSGGMNRMIPDYMRRRGGWYEEDCAWSIVVTVFPEKFGPEEVEMARDSLRNWFPDEYEKFYNVRLKEGESWTRDEALFYERNRDKLVAVAAWGDWHETVPEGMVGVCAVIGSKAEGRRYSRSDEHYLLVPDEEYEKRGRFAFVFEDPSQYRKWEPHA